MLINQLYFSLLFAFLQVFDTDMDMAVPDGNSMASSLGL
jgi:hypothetical protein